MAELINLKRARKARARTESEAAAEANRAKFGRTKAERQASETLKAQAERRLDGAKREP